MTSQNIKRTGGTNNTANIKEGTEIWITTKKDLNRRFVKLVSLTVFQSSFLLFVEFDKMPYEVNLIVQVEFLSE